MDKISIGFLEELSALTREWGVEIGGCGCCGSPWVSVWDGAWNNLGKHLTWNKDVGMYETDKYYWVNDEYVLATDF